MTSPILTFGFSLGMVTFLTTGVILRGTPRGGKQIIEGCSYQEHPFFWAFEGEKRSIGGRGNQGCHVVFGGELEPGFAGDADPVAMGRELDCRAAACSERSADGCTLGSSNDSAKHGARNGASADAFGALGAAAFSNY